MKFQIERTIQHHFDKELKYIQSPYGYKNIKVISLIFIDKVANYRKYEDGKQFKGKFAIWFEEIFNKKIGQHKSNCEDKLFIRRVKDEYFEPENSHSTDIVDPFFRRSKSSWRIFFTG